MKSEMPTLSAFSDQLCTYNERLVLFSKASQSFKSLYKVVQIQEVQHWSTGLGGACVRPWV